jgi:hypothetical protein
LEESSLIFDESSGDDEESLSSSSLKREGPSLRILEFVFKTPNFGFFKLQVLDFPLTRELGYVDDCSLESAGRSLSLDSPPL